MKIINAKESPSTEGDFFYMILSLPDFSAYHEIGRVPSEGFMNLSLCMIVKNEEKTIGRCLAGVAEAVDEIIIVDTGSTDKTKEIAGKYTDKIYDFAWNDDFSAARNFSFSKATGDFILWLDADDVLTFEELEKFIDFKKTLSEKDDVVLMRYECAFDEDGNAVFFFYRERIFRRAKDFLWKGRVHEAVEYSGNVRYSDIAIKHFSAKTEYGDRNLKIYEKQKASGEAFSPRDVFYYGRELFYHKRYGDAKKTLCSFLENPNGWVENKIEACKFLSEIYLSENDTENAAKTLFSSFLYGIPRAEICCRIGNIFVGKGQYETAVFWYKSALSAAEDGKGGAFVSSEYSGFIPLIMLTFCHDRTGKLADAEEYNRRAGKLRPNSKEYLYNLKYFEGLKNSVYKE